MNKIYDFIEDSANAGLDFFFKFKCITLKVFMWMCIFCTIFTLNIFTGILAFFVFFYLKRIDESAGTRRKFKIIRKIK